MAKRIQKSSGGGISIHAPAWGATRGSRTGGVAEDRISIHAPAWGATNDNQPRLPGSRNFNSRPRVGGDEGYRFVPAGAS